tara:strand:+ start:169 stop:342 length:174 start_codon:yes stop_codon:yes gene_type:complete
MKSLIKKIRIVLGDNSHSTHKLFQIIKNNRNYILFREKPNYYWYPVAGIGISYPKSP